MQGRGVDCLRFLNCCLKLSEGADNPAALGTACGKERRDPWNCSKGRRNYQKKPGEEKASPVGKLFSRRKQSQKRRGLGKGSWGGEKAPGKKGGTWGLALSLPDNR